MDGCDLRIWGNSAFDNLAIMPADNAIYQWIHCVDYEDFDLKVIAASHERPVLVDLWAEWCAPCLVIAPVLERVIGEYLGRVHLAKVEVDAGENMKLAGHYRVRGFPTLILFEDGEERGRFHGAHPAPFVRAFLSNHCTVLQD
jgi:putative thioredoxin